MNPIETEATGAMNTHEDDEVKIYNCKNCGEEICEGSWAYEYDDELFDDLVCVAAYMADKGDIKKVTAGEE